MRSLEQLKTAAAAKGKDITQVVAPRTHAEKLLTWLQRPLLVARGPPVAPFQVDTLAVS